MKRTSNFKPHDVSSEQRSDGTLLLRSNAEMGDVVDTSADWLHRWSEEAPERIFLAERSGSGWREETYQSTLQKVRAIAASLLARGMGPDTPILIMSGNGVDHGLLTLAAHYVGFKKYLISFFTFNCSAFFIFRIFSVPEVIK